MSVYLNHAGRASVLRAAAGSALIIILMAAAVAIISWIGFMFVTQYDNLGIRLFAVAIPLILAFATVVVGYFMVGKVRERITERERASLRVGARRSTHVEPSVDGARL